MAKKRQISDTKPVLQLRLEGPGIRPGAAPIPELVRLLEEAQSAINKQAEVLKNRKTIHPGPTAYSIQEECTLELIAIHGNSPTTLDFELKKPQIPLAFNEDFGTEVVREVAHTLKKISRSSKNGHSPIDPGLLQRVYSLSGVINPKTISRIEWIARSQNGHNKQITAPITKTIRTRAAKKLSSPRTGIAEVDGILEMADFKREDYKCRIDPPIGSPVLCTFEPEYADNVQKLMRQLVRARGEATIRPYTDKIDVLHIGELIPLAPQALSDRAFFANLQLADLIKDVQPINDPSALRGGIAEDEDVDKLLTIIYNARK